MTLGTFPRLVNKSATLVAWVTEGATKMPSGGKTFPSEQSSEFEGVVSETKHGTMTSNAGEDKRRWRRERGPLNSKKLVPKKKAR